jgi:peptidoglycan/LPS O-acetylase OafA/YrhL
LTVLIFHYFPEVLPTGFVGVDIFFVLSGFLITGLIDRELLAERFSFSGFYAKRAKRIFPSLIACLFLMWVVGILCLFPFEFKELGRQIRSGAGFFSNFLFLKEAGYFDTLSDLKPFLNLWSLSLEEQFYLFWPFLFWFLAKRRVDAKIPVLVLTVLSFALNIFWIKTNPPWAFYFPLARFWEFGFGALLALGADKIFPSSLKPGSWMTSVIGLALIGFASLGFFKASEFPGFWALLPVTGASLLILRKPAGLNRVQLWVGHAPLIFFGQISYSLYLWHWPLLVVLRFFSMKPAGVSVQSRLVFLIGSVFVSWAQTKFFEEKIRYANFQKKTVAVVSGVSLSALLLVGCLAVYGWPSVRLQGSPWKDVSEAAQDFSYPEFEFKDNRLTTVDFPGRVPEKVIFWGDSHMEQFYPHFIDFYDHAVPRPYYTAILATSDGCPPVPHMESLNPTGVPCEKIFAATLKMAQDPRVKKVVMTAHWRQYIDQYRQFNAQMMELNQVMQQLKLMGKQIYIILSTPYDESFDPRYNLPSRLTGKFETTQEVVDLKTFRKADKVMRDKLIEIAKASGAELIDPVPFQCPNDICQIRDGDRPVYKDSNHWRPFYARKMAGFLDFLMTKP